MSKKSLLKTKSVRGFLANVAAALGIILLLAVIYFYIYLPNVTNHLESITVPDLTGMHIDELDSFLKEHDLRYGINDSSYSSEYPPLTVLRQFPQADSKVKENRMIYVSLNRVAPPTLPMPNLVDGSLMNAELVLKSNDLKRGRIIYRTSNFPNLVLEMQMDGKTLIKDTRIPKGSVIDLVVGDGNGPADFVIGNLMGDLFETAKFKIGGWDLHLGNVEIPEGIDTTGIDIFVFKQFPMPGDSVRVGDPVDLWLGPKGYKEPDIDNDDETEPETDLP